MLFSPKRLHSFENNNLYSSLEICYDKIHKNNQQKALIRENMRSFFVRGTHKTNKQAFLFLAIGIFVYFLSLFSFAEEIKRHGNVIEVQTGQVFVIALDSNRSTGFAWQLARPPDKNKIEFVCSRYKSIFDNRIGGPGEEELIFKAVGIGKAIIRLKYVRSSEKNKAPAVKKTFVIIIKKPASR